jgi:hypothetical protein
MRLNVPRSGLFLLFLSACGSSSMSVPDGATGAAGSDGQAGQTGGPDVRADQADVGSGGTGGGAGDAGPDSSADAVVYGEAGVCNSGLPETAMIVRGVCTGAMTASGGTIPDGQYQLVSLSVTSKCSPVMPAPPTSRAFIKTGNLFAGVDGTADATGAITTWTHWRAMVTAIGTQISASFQCGRSDLGIAYTVVDDGVILFVDHDNSGWAYRYKRL